MSLPKQVRYQAALHPDIGFIAVCRSRAEAKKNIVIIVLKC